METVRVNNEGWTKTSSQVFWGEIAPCDHVVQIYENDEVFLDLLAGFVVGGVAIGESVIVIATDAHLKLLNTRLNTFGYVVSHLISKNQYFPLNAEETLAKFMVNDWPDEYLFNHVVSDLIGKAKGKGRRVRAFGEMVAILWGKGQVDATVRLEHLWNKFCAKEAFSLFCAYPQTGFTRDASESVMHICGAHSKMIAAIDKGGVDELLFKEVSQKIA